MFQIIVAMAEIAPGLTIERVPGRVGARTSWAKISDGHGVVGGHAIARLGAPRGSWSAVCQQTPNVRRRHLPRIARFSFGGVIDLVERSKDTLIASRLAKKHLASD